LIEKSNFALQDRGNKEQARTHANIARRHAVSALAAGDGAHSG
jgi:hypothetical protein